MRRLRDHYLPHLGGRGTVRELYADERPCDVEGLVRRRILRRYVQVTWPGLPQDVEYVLLEADDARQFGKRWEHDDDVSYRAALARGLLDPETGWPTFELPPEAKLLEDNAEYVRQLRAIKAAQLKRRRAR